MNFDKTKTSSIALILMLTFSATILALPMVSAHDPAWEVPTFSFISLSRNPIGVNQEVFIIFWLNEAPKTAVGGYGDRWKFSVEVTTPSGSEETLGPFTSDPVGTGYALYSPNQIGTYTFVAKFHEYTITGLPIPPGFTIDTIRNADYVNDTFLASTSDPVQLDVQEDTIEPWKETPLPEEYWTRPINSMNREWASLAANWLAGAAQNVGPTYNFAFGPGPESSHIMWATPMWAGGFMDTRFGNTAYQSIHYEGIGLSPPIILNGKIYYNIRSLPREGWQVIDLYTGEKLWFQNTTGPVTRVSASSSGSIPGGSLAFGQIYDYHSPNQHGGFPYLWSTSGPSGTWQMFDAETGNYICSIANVSAQGTQVYGKDGSILYYRINNNRLTVWNTSQAIWWKPYWSSNEYWMWRPGLNETYDGNNGFSLDVPVPDLPGIIRAVREDECIIGGTEGTNYPDNPVVQGNLWALSLEKGQEGTLLWNITFTPPLASAVPGETVNTYRGMRYETISPEDGVFIFREQLTRKYWGYSLETGEQLWESTPENSMQFYGLSTARNTNIYQGKFFSYGYGGTVTCYNITTGEILWVYTAKQEGFESPYGNYPIGIAAVADGKLYLTSSEHSPTQPLWRGSYLRCINATDGEEIWKVSHWSTGMAAGAGVFIADGFVVSLNSYDNRIYCYGKGPSATTVTIQDDVAAWGDSVLFKGTVTDQSPGTKQLEQASRFPNGVPAVSDASQEGWMEYVYMQQACPTSVEGVEVKLETLDPNNNFYEIGRTTTDASGFYSLDWQPPVPGKYTIYATFEGSESYYRSYSETAMLVTEASSLSTQMEPELTTPEPTASEATEAPLISTEVAIIALVGIVAFWALRKRK